MHRLQYRFLYLSRQWLTDHPTHPPPHGKNENSSPLPPLPSPIPVTPMTISSTSDTFNSMDQFNPILAAKIKKDHLIYHKQNHSNLRTLSYKQLKGQFGQPVAIDALYG